MGGVFDISGKQYRLDRTSDIQLWTIQIFYPDMPIDTNK